MLSRSILALLSLLTLAYGHIVITYPGWRGDNLHSNGTVQESNGLETAPLDDKYIWPYGMQWSYPCTLSGRPAVKTTVLTLSLSLSF